METAPNTNKPWLVRMIVRLSNGGEQTQVARAQGQTSPVVHSVAHAPQVQSKSACASARLLAGANSNASAKHEPKSGPDGHDSACATATWQPFGSWSHASDWATHDPSTAES
jgi:hypothetical protein